MAAAAAAKPRATAAEMDKDVQSLMELQDKLSMHAGLNQMVMQQMQKARVAHKRTELVLQELAHIATNVPVYKQVGKAYFMMPMQELRNELKDDASRCDDEVKRLTQQQQHAAKKLAATEAEIQELFKSNPELTRQLLPASA